MARIPGGFSQASFKLNTKSCNQLFVGDENTFTRKTLRLTTTAELFYESPLGSTAFTPRESIDFARIFNALPKITSKVTTFVPLRVYECFNTAEVLPPNPPGHYSARHRIDSGQRSGGIEIISPLKLEVHDAPVANRKRYGKPAPGLTWES